MEWFILDIVAFPAFLAAVCFWSWLWRRRRWALLARARESCARLVGRARALRGAESKAVVKQLPAAFFTVVARRSLTELARVLHEACFEHTRRALARVVGCNWTAAKVERQKLGRQS